jgi:osmotically inducible protein OsmC
MIKQSHATAVWSGDLRSGTGVIDSQHGAVRQVAYNFPKRFESEQGTNPEELIAAAHAACYSMALSGELAKNQIVAESITTTATTTLDMVDGKPTVSTIHLATVVKARGADRNVIHSAAEAAKGGCPISRLLNTKIMLDVSVA